MNQQINNKFSCHFDVLLNDLLVDLTHAIKQAANPFITHIVIVPHFGLANYLRDNIANALGICSNVSFMTIAQFIDLIYNKYYIAQNNINGAFEFGQSKFILYQYLQKKQLVNAKDNCLLLQLATQCQAIFDEYIHLRTQEALKGSLVTQMPSYQAKLWRHLLKVIASKQQYTFLDIYTAITASSNICDTFSRNPSSEYDTSSAFNIANSRMMAADTSLNNHVIIANKVFIFALDKLFASQLEIIQVISSFIEINWYYLSLSNHYYGDLLPQKILLKTLKRTRKQFTINDLCLTNGNLLVANLGQLSRELTELLLEYDMMQNDYIEANDNDCLNHDASLLRILQNDIRNITKRDVNNGCDDNKLNSVYHADATHIATNDDSIIVNVCHNRMREVQVAFSEICRLLALDSSLCVSDIALVAPNIDEYASYIEAVFTNERIAKENNVAANYNKASGDGSANVSNPPLGVATDATSYRALPFSIYGSKIYVASNNKVIDCLTKMVNIPPSLPVGYLLGLLHQEDINSAFSFSNNDIELIATWLADNNFHDSYTDQDQNNTHGIINGNNDQNIHSIENTQNHNNTNPPYVANLKQLAINLTLGLCLCDEIFLANKQLPMLAMVHGVNVPYDNIEISQLELLNKLLAIINALIRIRDTLYSRVDAHENSDMVSLQNECNSYHEASNTLDERDTIDNISKTHHDLHAPHDHANMPDMQNNKVAPRYVYKNISLDVAVNLIDETSKILQLARDKQNIVADLLVYLQNAGDNSGVHGGVNIMKMTVDLPVINELLQDYSSNKIFTGSVKLNGKLCATSLHLIHRIPFRVIYILGMGGDQFPRVHHFNVANILNKEHRLGDRNINLYDKQVFIDTILSAKDYLRISYIGRSQYNNTQLPASSVLSLLIEVLRATIANDNFNFVRIQPLHPFNSNTDANSNNSDNSNNGTNGISGTSGIHDTKWPSYSFFWHKISNKVGDITQDKRWLFAPFIANYNTTTTCVEPKLQITLATLSNTFFYNNTNLLAALLLKEYPMAKDKLSDDNVSLELLNRQVKNNLCALFKRLNSFENMNICWLREQYGNQALGHYLRAKGYIAYGRLGEYQLSAVLALYERYHALLSLGNSCVVNFYSPKYKIAIYDKLVLDGDNNLVILEELPITSRAKSSSGGLSYRIKIQAMIYFLLSKFATFSCAINQVRVIFYNVDPKKPIIYQISTNCTERENAYLWGEILDLYRFSLDNPFVVEKNSISKYCEGNFNQLCGYFAKEAPIRLGAYISNDAKEFNKLRLDPTIEAIVDKYCQLFTEQDKRNTLVRIGRLLRHLVITLV